MPLNQGSKKPPFQSDISLRLENLNTKRQEIIRPVLENPRDFVLLNVRDMASRLGTGTTTVLRLVQALGFESYKSFQHYLHELSVASATILDPMRAVRHAAPTPVFIKSSAEQILKNLHSLQDGLDVTKILDLANRLYKARRILLLGGDTASSLVNYLEYRLAMIGLPVFVATAPGRTTHLTRSMGKQDLVIGMTFRRGLRMTIEGMEKAHAHGAHCVGITDSHLSPIVRFSDSYFVVPVTSLSFAASYVAPIALIDLITAAAGNLKRDRIMARLKEADEEQRHGYRWYQKES